ncbi:MAG: tetratricopeptide repeat protein [Chloroflexota bacterium]
MRLTGDRLRLSRDGPRLSPIRLLFYLVPIAGGLLVLWLLKIDRIQPLFTPPPTPTRTSLSYAEAGTAYFSAGDLGAAIQAYQAGVRAYPNDARLMAELARVQTYSSALQTTAEKRRELLGEARQAVDRAVELAPDDAFSQAIRALVYDWSASSEASIRGPKQREEFLTVAQTSATRALQLEPGNPLALAFAAEVLNDQQSFAQAIDLASQAVSGADPQDPYSMDIHRVYGTVLESNGQYRLAIEEYSAAAAIAPNFTFLYLLIGANYRQLRDIDTALEYFDRAARINEQLSIEDPTPYLAIGRTYLQQGEFFIAARNIERALAIDDENPDIYGRLGIVFFRARNYESAVVVLECAVDGCSQEVSRRVLCEFVYGCDPESADAQQYGVDVTGLELGDDTLEYYYTYGSVLTYFRNTADRPTACQDAERIFSLLLAAYGDDPVVTGIASESRALCAAGPATAVPTATPPAE